MIQKQQSMQGIKTSLLQLQNLTSFAQEPTLISFVENEYGTGIESQITRYSHGYFTWFS